MTLGHIGQKTFEVWCASVDILAHPPDPDMTGWDYILEFPPDKDYHGPTDLRPAPLQCLIQVRASKAAKRSTQLKLSNLERLTKSPLPTFVIFLHFNDEDEIATTYLVEIGDDLIERTLHRLRELHLRGKTDFHRHTLTVRANDQDLIEPTAIALKQGIENYLHEGIAEYTKHKLTTISKCGFENGGTVVNFNLIGDEISRFTDALLGLNISVKADKIIVAEERFGIRIEKAQHTSGGQIVISDVKPVSKVRLLFSDDDFLNSFEFDADLFLAPLVQNQPDAWEKARFKSEFFEIIFSRSGEVNCYFTYDFDQRYTLTALRQFIRLNARMKTSSTMQFRALVGQKIFGHGFMSPNSPCQIWQELAEIADQATSLARSCDRDHKITISFSELIAAKSRLTLSDIFINNIVTELTVEFACVDELTSTEIYCLSPFQVRLGDHLIGGIATISGARIPEITEKVKIKANDIVDVQTFARKEDESTMEKEIFTLMDDMASRFDVPERDVVIIRD